MTRLLATVTAVLVCAAAAASTPAHARAVIGVGDQKASMFDDPRFRDLGIRHARLSVAWDAMAYPWQVQEIDDWMAGARRAGVEPLVTFGHSRTVRRSLPSPSRFKYEFRRFRARYPWVETYATWNEANHCGEPTCHRPALVAAYYKAMRRECRGCTILAAELLDMPNMVAWTRSFRKAAKQEPPYWGLHNYIDANRFRTTSTRALLDTVKGDVWLTEVGGLVRRRTRVRVPLNESPAHAIRAMRWLFREIVPMSPRITHVFVYHWRASGPRDTWDSALFTPGGRPRGSFRIFQREVLQRRRP